MKHMKSYEKYMRKNEDFIDINDEIKNILIMNKKVNDRQYRFKLLFDVVGYC